MSNETFAALLAHLLDPTRLPSYRVQGPSPSSEQDTAVSSTAHTDATLTLPLLRTLPLLPLQGLQVQGDADRGVGFLCVGVGASHGTLGGAPCLWGA